MRIPFIMIIVCGSLKCVFGMIQESSNTVHSMTKPSSMVPQGKSVMVTSGDTERFEQSKHSKSPQKLPTGRKKDDKMRIHQKDEKRDKQALKDQETPTSISYIEPHANEVLNPILVNDYIKEAPKLPLESMEHTLEKTSLLIDEKINEKNEKN